ncbi:YcjF family protein [Marinibacterium sp. SX1]|uniref:YcjF family protein n=1 Tax=Marinibacterium sp. SX1 TaxID=3388424 RepID=UPI003D17DFD9
MSKGPVLFDLEPDPEGPRPGPAPSVADAPPVPDLSGPEAGPEGTAMEAAMRAGARPSSALAKWFWGLATSLLGLVLSVAAWQFAASLVASVPILGWIVTGLLAAFVLVGLLVALRELAAFGRLGRIDSIKHDADMALAEADLEAARGVVRQLQALYAGREDTRWGRDRLAERVEDQFDAAALFGLAEDTLLAPLDAAARREVEAAARQVATVTALVPLALADVVAAFASSLRMIRRVAEIYGGRSGFFGGLRLTRAVFTHLVATGAVAAGEDLLEPVLGGSVLSKLSRRFGEGLVNGALSARVGVAAMEVCRPLPFSPRHRPSVRGIIKSALAGLIGRRG